MVGLIPNLLLKIVETSGGEPALLEVKRRAGVPLDRRYPLDSLCPDDEWQRLLQATCEVLDLSPAEAERAYADFFGRDSLTRWPKWFEMASNSREFLLRQPTIHNVFAMSVQRGIARQQVNDKFHHELRDDELVITYRSPNKHCGLFKELARWIADHYGDRIEIDEPRCLKRGDEACELHVRWLETGQRDG